MTYIKNHNDTFSATMYRKKTFTGRYAKWDSFTTRKHKLNLIRRLVCYNRPWMNLGSCCFKMGYPRGGVNYNINDIILTKFN